VDDLDEAVEADERGRCAPGCKFVDPRGAPLVRLERGRFGLGERDERSVELAEDEALHRPMSGQPPRGQDAGYRSDVPDVEAAAEAEAPHRSSSPSLKPRDRTVWMRGGPAPASIFLRRWLTWTSTTFVRSWGSSPHTDSPILLRVTTSPACRIKVSRIEYSLGVKAISLAPRVTRWVTGSSVRSAIFRTGGRVSSERRSSARIRASSSSNAKGLVR